MSAPYMPLFVADYLADTAHLSAAENGAYMLLLMNYWQRGKALPADDRKLARIARMRDDEWADVRDTIAEFFIEEGDEWRHKRVEREIAVAQEKSDKAKKSARAAVEARKANADRTVAERSPDADLLGEDRGEENPSSAIASEGKRARGALSDWPEDFREAFWDAYPSKVGKIAAIRKLEGIRKRGDLPWQRLIDGLRRYAAKTDDRPWCNPEVWLNQGRWDDEPAQAKLPAMAGVEPPKHGERRNGKVYLMGQTPQFDAWRDRLNRSPTDRNGGWWFDSEWPPSSTHPATDRAA